MAILDNKERLWIEYSHSKDSALREQIIIEYVPLVKLVAGRLSIYLGSNVEYDDLVSYGIFGLIDAIDKFDYGKGIKFETYASLRIRGAILDQIRKLDWIPRSVRQKQKAIDAAIKKLETEKGPSYTDEDIAKELGITEDEYVSWQGQTNISNVSSLEDFLEQGNEVRSSGNPAYMRIEPENVIMEKEMKKSLVEALDSLTEKERNVVLLYYYEELTLKEISRAMSVSESRVSQLHSKALKKMKTFLGDNFTAMMG
ncbi:MAG: FliA/WhiG family RNA polymerase sigma factor [Clostridium sp.]|nr:FliA/WhiG family RNA polymerase sigma factor [Clostridium sp.]MCM1397980.1 FliA/WhiG family RNA polymerase sigma factor [Clostridium sp.]MCM1459384.1 FliA/WhiG family RNA polymerase sigma factor [Bacteroides sp.]